MPLDLRLIHGSFAGATLQATGETKVKNQLLEFCKTPRSRDEMQEFLGLSDREHFRLNILRPLIASGEFLLTIPDKPTSPKQKYCSKYNQNSSAI